MKVLIRYTIFAWSYLVIVAWGLSAVKSLHWWTFRWSVLVLLLALVYKLPRKNLKKHLKKPKFSKTSKDLFVTLAITAWIIFIGYCFFRIFVMPPENWDSMTYHLTSIADANQTGSLWYNKELPITRANFSQMNAEILMLACFSILGRDILVELPQLIAAIGTALLLIFISKEIFKIDYKNGIIASIAILSIPLFWYEAVTTQNDLIFVFAILLAIASLIRLQKKQNKLNLIESILAIALVIGTKYSGLVAGGLLGILLLFILYKNLKFSRKHLLWIVGAGLVSIIIALPNFIIAQLYYGSFLHQPKRVAEQLSPGPETLYTNLKHFLEWFYSAPKYDPIYFSHNTGHAGIWFMLALPFIALILIYNYKKLNAKNVLVLLPVIGFTFIFLLSHYPDPWDLRLMLIFPILTVYFAFTYVINSKDRIIKSFAIFSIFFLFGLNFFTIFRYDYKENLKSATKSLVYDHDFYSVGDDTKHYRWALIPFEAKSLPHTKSNKILYHTKNKDSWVYNFWGEYWQNQLFYVDEFDELIKKGNSQNYDYAVIMQYESLDLNKIPEQWEFLDEDERQVIYKLR